MTNAIVTFEELPYGSSIGIIKANKASGYFEFYTLGHEGYRIEVKAVGHRSIIENIYPLSESVNGVMSKTYYLIDDPEVGEIIRLENLIFEQGKSEITFQSYQELDNLATTMKNNKEMIIQLEGHTDFRGSKSENLKLSEERVLAVKNYLVRKGIAGNRILTKAFGGTRPITREETEEASRLNRRVEVRIIKK